MVSAKARLKRVYPLIAIGTASVLVLTLFSASPGYWLDYPIAAALLFGIIIACGAVFALLFVAFAKRIENFLVGPRRTHWILDQQVTIASEGSWTYPFHLPKNGWLGVLCDSDSNVSVEILRVADAAQGAATPSGKPEEAQRNVRKASVTYRAGHEGNWILAIRNMSSKPTNVYVKVSEWVTSWS